MNLAKFIDFTTLSDTDTQESVRHLCETALSLPQKVAAICVYPQFIETVRDSIGNTEIKICSVANFPEGSSDIDQTVKMIFNNMVKGVHEIDIVMPYHAYLAGETHLVEPFVKICKQACGSKVILKVILETGALQTADKIYAASKAAISGGADFIKTSTGKIAVNATLEASEIMLHAIKDSGKKVGFKAAGGIRTTEQAKSYFDLAEKIMGPAWLTPENFRIGTSSLLVFKMAFSSSDS